MNCPHCAAATSRPGVTLILSSLLLGEDLSLAKIVGLGLVILGVLLVIKKE